MFSYDNSSPTLTSNAGMHFDRQIIIPKHEIADYRVPPLLEFVDIVENKT